MQKRWPVGSGPVWEDMAEMPAAATAVNLGACHEEAVVRRGAERALERREEARPPGAAVIFRLGGERAVPRSQRT